MTAPGSAPTAPAAPDSARACTAIGCEFPGTVTVTMVGPPEKVGIPVPAGTVMPPSIDIGPRELRIGDQLDYCVFHALQLARAGVLL